MGHEEVYPSGKGKFEDKIIIWIAQKRTKPERRLHEPASKAHKINKARYIDVDHPVAGTWRRSTASYSKTSFAERAT
jgi:hypothetical protein